MSSLGFVRVGDQLERREALDPRRSFIVQAPAGSGKTELLIRRYLALLAVVEKPERILAMTFTRKAAAEMRERILGALSTEETPLARAAMENPARVRVMTIDSLCGSLVAQMPWLARQGAVPEIVEDAGALYRSAAQRTVLMVERDGPHTEWIEHLLAHRDNKTGKVAELIAEMLAKRDQWLAHEIGSREEMEATLERVRDEAYSAVEGMMQPHQRAEIWTQFGDLDAAVEGLLTKTGTWRKKGTPVSLTLIPGLEGALHGLRKLPPARFDDGQWRTLRALLETLKLAVGQLWVVFQEESKIDFCEMAMAPRNALGEAEDPSELALKLDARIEHLLIDEFQDTSEGQFALTKKLTEGWERGDGRTVFLVGDPMQSIYRFRQANVGLFLDTAEKGLGTVRTEPLVLRANFRSAAGVVEWVNRVFGRVFPGANDAGAGAVKYSASEAVREAEGDAVTAHGFAEKDYAGEARAVVELARNAEGTVAVLVRARTHLPAIVEELKRTGMSFRAVKIDALGQRQSVLDLLSLTRAMLHLGDRVAWLAVLRAPWCGLTLGDLHAVVGDGDGLVWDLLQGDLRGLSLDGQARARKLRGVMEAAFEQRGRASLRMWVERTWRELGGEAGRDSEDYFALLEKEQAGGDLPDFDGFAGRVKGLKAQADPGADERLQLMTIHEAKGLQFDTVILPGLGRRPVSDKQSMFLYHEGLLAPIEEAGSEGDRVYEYLREMEKRKSANEVVRQLYVAATRAKKHLHLVGGTNENGKAKAGSFLAVLWEGLEEEERARFVVAGKPVEELTERRAPGILRLPLEWEAARVEPVKWEGARREAEAEREPTFEWVGDELRHAGTVVHAILRRIAREPRYRADAGAVRTQLAKLGVAAKELERTAERVERAVARTLGSERGRWILAPHREARCEVAVAATVDGTVVRGTIDRTFVDEDGTRWIVDFKTGTREGGGVGAFLDEEMRRHRPQMERYGRIFRVQGGVQGAPVRLGLYFPLLDAWRELSL